MCVCTICTHICVHACTHTGDIPNNNTPHSAVSRIDICGESLISPLAAHMHGQHTGCLLSGVFAPYKKAELSFQPAVPSSHRDCRGRRDGATQHDATITTATTATPTTCPCPIHIAQPTLPTGRRNSSNARADDATAAFHCEFSSTAHAFWSRFARPLADTQKNHTSRAPPPSNPSLRLNIAPIESIINP